VAVALIEVLVPTGTGSKTDAFRRLRKAALVIKRLRLRVEELQYLRTLGGGHLLMNDLTAGPTGTLGEQQALFAKLEKLIDFAIARDGIKAGPDAFLDLLGTAGNLADRLKAVAEATGHAALDLSTCATNFGISIADFADEVPVLKLQRAMEPIARLGVSAAKAFEWAELEVDACPRASSSHGVPGLPTQYWQLSGSAFAVTPSRSTGRMVTQRGPTSPIPHPTSSRRRES
jgi:hypothetical protein